MSVPRPVRGGSSPPTNPKFSHLSPPRQQLVRLLQDLFYGSVLELAVRDGEPVFDPGPRIVRSVKLSDARRNRPCPQADAEDFALRREVLALMGRLDELVDGLVLRLDVAHGLPTAVKLEGVYIDDGEVGQ